MNCWCKKRPLIIAMPIVLATLGLAFFLDRVALSQPVTPAGTSGAVKAANPAIPDMIGQGAHKVTQADRQAAAGTAIAAGAGVHAMALDPNAPPDYFGMVPNYANSQLTSPNPSNAPGPDYYWPWYDSQLMNGWVLMGAPSSGTYVGYNLSIAGQQKTLPDAFGWGPGTIPAGKTQTFTQPGLMGGPVEASVTKNGGPGIVSQRMLMGNSFEEVPGSESSKMSDNFYWSWYDEQTTGYQNWVVVNNPSATDTVHAQLYYTPAGSTTQELMGESDIGPGGSWTPRFPGDMGGPLELRAYIKGGGWAVPTDHRNVVASQRVLSNSGAAFNEVPGTPASELSGDYIWTWYDQLSPGLLNWVLLANPGASDVNYMIRIAGSQVASGTIPAGSILTPTFPSRRGGPVEVKSCSQPFDGSGNCPDASPPAIIASQRIIAGPSFEEVPGYPQASLSNSYTWTWYDMKSPGVINWVLIANVGAAPVSYTVKIAGQQVASGNLAAGATVTPTFPGLMNGPVEVSASGPVIASQRVMWNGYFNEVRGTGSVLPATGIRKFVDALPGLGRDQANGLGQYIPKAVPDTSTFQDADYYEIAELQFNEQMSADLPPTPVRGYVQIETPNNAGVSLHVPLTFPDGSQILDRNGQQVYGVDAPHYMGPAIVADENRPVRIKYTNYLPPEGMTGAVYLPMDTSYMGAGEGDLHSDGSPCDPATETCANYTNNRAAIHLHGGDTVWISDGTPQQWRIPRSETHTPYSAGPDAQDVPDMWFDASGNVLGGGPAFTPPAGATTDPGSDTTTLFYSNEQSARLMFYHDHDYGTTRLNVYDGMAAPYELQDPIEQSLVTNGTIPATDVPLVVQDKTYVPDTSPDGQLAKEDPTWDVSKWGGTGSLWFPHVYMPNQNPFDTSGANPMGRWDYGPWFWPPYTGLANGPLANPYYGQPGEPPQIPGTPTPSGVPEGFMDTPVINGTAYPYMKVERKAYRFRILNASNDRYLNLQLYYASSNNADASDPATGQPVLQKASGDVRMVPATTNMGLPANWPTDGRAGGAPDPVTAGPNLIQIGNEGGFLPAPYVVPNQPVGYEYNRRNITVLNVSNKALFLGPAERADVIVDFSKVPEGSKLIMYNDAPAPVPGFDPRNDYYTGDPDLTTTGGAPTTPGGYGPDTRTMMQFQVSGPQSAPFDLAGLQSALPAAYAQTQAPPIVPQAPYDQAFNKTFPQNNYSTIQATSLNFFNGPLLGSVGAIEMTNGGSGYNSATPPAVEITGGGGQGATGTAVVDGSGAVTGVIVTGPGTGYTSRPDVVFVDNGGGSGAAATASLASAITVTEGGSGYTSPPNVNISGGGGSGATATASINSGGVTGIKLTNGGSGYPAAPTVVIDPPPGPGTQATATATISSHQVSGITITNMGSGYDPAHPPGLSFTGGGTGAAATAEVSGVTGITLTNPGDNYTSAPTVSIEPPASGVTATALAAGMTFPMQPKTIQELFEVNYGRMNATLGTELPFTNINTQTTIPLGYIDPPTEEFKISDLGQPIGVAADGTQIWKITHNGVDTHAIHVHLNDVQLINRIGWDGAIKPPDPNEVGWKETVRMNPLEDAVVAFRPVKPNYIPFAVPDSVRPFDTTNPLGTTSQFTNLNPATGNPLTTINAVYNFGWQYVWHCHLLGHEENDMMRPQVFRTAPPAAPQSVTATETNPTLHTVTVNWSNTPAVPGANQWVIQRAADAGFTTGVAAFSVSTDAVPIPTSAANATPLAPGTTYYYRMRAENSVYVSDWSNTATVTTGP